MKRSRIDLGIRGAVLTFTLLGGWFFGIAPVWTRGTVRKVEADRLQADVARVEAGWASLSAVPNLDNTRILADRNLAALLVDSTEVETELPPVQGEVPTLLTEMTRLGEQLEIIWTDIEALPAEPAAVILSDGETVDAARIRLKVSGNGAYTSIGRAVREMQTGGMIVAVRDVAMTAADNGTVDAQLTIDVYGAPR